MLVLTWHMRTIFLWLLLYTPLVYAGTITGKVIDHKGQALPFASIIVKETKQGTTSNQQGKYSLSLPTGTYTISCQHVGYEKKEQVVVVNQEVMSIDFQLSPQPMMMQEVIVRQGAEDPAYEIIRNAIKKRSYYAQQLENFQCEVYTKGQFRLRDFPKKFMGQKVDFEDGDTGKQKMLYLAETIARYSIQPPNKSKIEVLSTRVSGQSNGFGFSTPQIFSFYDNNVQIGEQLNPRGFVSPIANNALQFYKYKYEGSFWEDGKEINQIKVIPKRKYEPLFSGYINITEQDWRIHSVSLMLTKASQMQLVDTLRIEQLFSPLQADVWVIQSQVIYPAIKFLGFDAYGSFVNVYSKFNVNPELGPKFFNNTVLKYEQGSNKRSMTYWDTIRPVPLQTDEILDYRKKDSLEQVRKDPRYLDSLDRRRNKLQVMGVMLTGQSFSNSKKRSYFSITPVLQAVSFNTVEGWVFNPKVSYTKQLDTANGRRAFSITPQVRYGFNNGHLNASIAGSYSYGKKYLSSISFSGGKKVFQINNGNPIGPLFNTTSTLLRERNYMKIYEAWFANLRMSKGIGEGVTLVGNFQYQNRQSLDNTTDYKWNDRPDVVYSPNYPTELLSANFADHSSAWLVVGIDWRPGGRYIEFPDRKINIGSRYPTFSASISRSLPGLFGSNADWGRWRVGVRDETSLKLWGSFNYSLAAGGFYRAKQVDVPDYKHFNGNRLLIAGNYLSSFQLLPYYKYSTTQNFYGEGHIEHHFNGLLTNKIPGFRKLNWHLVAGANALYLDAKQHYTEAFVGIENIFRLIRVDWVWGFDYGRPATTGLRIGITGLSNGGAD
jgi:hypothetical protein